MTVISFLQMRWIVLLLTLSGPAAAESNRPPMMSPEAHGQWSAIGRVNVTGYNRRSACSGTLIAPDRVLTAAHCVFRGAQVARASDIRFASGWFRGEVAALGRVAAVQTPRGWTPTSRSNVNTVASDIAILTLTAPLAGIVPLPLSDGTGGRMRIIGYRWDRPHALTDHTPCIGTARFAPALGLSCAVVSGTSGAPVLTLENSGWAVMGVTSAISGGMTLAAPVSRTDIPH